MTLIIQPNSNPNGVAYLLQNSSLMYLSDPYQFVSFFENDWYF